ncbi:MAG: tRNA (N6-threonylcarbamoyladenosine(37)-N6)-methyltransferase TrmO [Ardenticatenaceae bacterium]|nr:tRNA (N6-threonylcarbamoyladenosine(37)-N6)-methyltransferase TrmO [Ardenticatenaceae bacterium]
MNEDSFVVKPIGTVQSELTDLAQAPKQGDEGGREAWLIFAPEVRDGLTGICVGDRLIVLTWLHLAQRDVLRVHPRGDQANPLQGVFTTRSPNRPNPIGLHQVEVLAIEEQRLKVAPLEAVDGTPIIDIKPVLAAINRR